jgi:hypothetical protein
MKIDPAENIMVMSRSIELPIVNSLKVPAWRASCRCLMTGNTLQGYPERCLVGFDEGEFDGKRKDNDSY